jgi:hypothetical protein
MRSRVARTPRTTKATRWGGARFKLYYGQLPFLGPKKPLYADGAASGAAGLQVMYIAITDGIVAPFAASAVLLNP